MWKDLADTLKNPEEFLKIDPTELFQIANGYLTRDQLKVARAIVGANPGIMEQYKNFNKERDGCKACLYYDSCKEVVGEPEYCSTAPKFTPRDIFGDIEGFKHMKKTA